MYHIAGRERSLLEGIRFVVSEFARNPQPISVFNVIILSNSFCSVLDQWTGHRAESPVTKPVLQSASAQVLDSMWSPWSLIHGFPLQVEGGPELLNFFGHITRLLGKELMIDSINSFPFHQLVTWSSKTFE